MPVIQPGGYGNSLTVTKSIVFLHVLRGDMEKTWTKDKVVWPAELLPKDISDSRVFLFGYDNGIVHRNPADVTKTELRSDADDLCAKLGAERSRTQTVSELANPPPLRFLS